MTDSTIQSPVHVCLISDHLLPNLIPILMERPATAHLVISGDRVVQGERFRRLLRDQGIACQLHMGAPSTGLPDLLNYAERLVKDLESAHAGQSIVLNATGGTKLMALAFVEVFRRLPRIRIVYTDTEHGRLEYLTGRSHLTRPLCSVLNIKTYLAAYGFTVSHIVSADDVWRERAEKRQPLSRWLAQKSSKLGDFLGALNRLASQALDPSGNTLIEPIQQFNTAPRNHWRTAMEIIARYELIAWEGGATFQLPSADAARYLNGLWLEEYVWHEVCAARPEEVQMGVTGHWENQDGYRIANEFDLLAVHNNRMLVVECKTSRFGKNDAKDQNILTKLESLSRNAGGLFARPVLISARPLPMTVHARARNQCIRIIEGNQLIELQSFIQDWMGSTP